MFGRHRENTDFLILALSVIFLFRTFVAEPLQVPTGSMGPTLLGRHKEVTCPHCSYPALCSSSEEIDLKTGKLWRRLVSAECPNCRRELDISDVPSKEGDRILVAKFPPGDYQRFDIAVFKNIDTPRTLYVKRLVGLPGETVRIHRGEVERWEQGEWQICRKSPEQVQSMAVLVYDDRYPVVGKPDHGTVRWQSSPPGAWVREANRYVLAGADAGELSYRHLLRSKGKPRLITDDLAYNSALSETEAENPNVHRSAAGHPVHDLLLDFACTFPNPSAELGVVLRAGRSLFRLEISEQSISMTWNGQEIGRRDRSAAAQQEQQFCFGQVDHQLLLWENGRLSMKIPLETSGSLNQLSEKDLHPLSMEGRGRGIVVSDLVLRRDIYYTRQSQGSDYFRPAVGSLEMDEFLSTPSKWRRLQEIKPQAQPWKLGNGEYIALGDNSLQSNDSRHWRQGPIVQERMILGRAELRLWPIVKQSLRIR